MTVLGDDYMVRISRTGGERSHYGLDAQTALDLAHDARNRGHEVRLYGPCEGAPNVGRRREIRAWNVPDPCPADCGCRVPGMPLACPTTTHNRTLGVRD